MSIYAFGSREAGPLKLLKKCNLVVSGSFPSAQRLHLDTWDMEEISTVQLYVLTEFATKVSAVVPREARSTGSEPWVVRKARSFEQ